MQTDYSTVQKLLKKNFTDAMIRIGLIVFLVVMCFRIFAPFANIMLWALILAVTLYPLHQGLTKRLKGKQGRAAVLLVLAGILLIAVPSAMIGGSFAKYIHKAYTAYENDTITIKQPDPKVADWPLVGEQIYESWSKAANNLPVFIKENKSQLGNISKRLLSAAANTAGSLLVFVGAFVIAGVIMAFGESGSNTMQKIINRLAGKERGPKLQNLSTATVRSVASGVIGVAFIQALLLGVGFIMADIPAAGVLAVIVMIIGILQLPASIISIPVIAFIWWSGDGSTLVNVALSVYLVAAGMADNVLKPMLLGRGVDAPMPVILLGALGGMIYSGIIGMFIGAVLLAVGYQVFMEWVNYVDEEDGTEIIETGSPSARE
ncbi:MAG: permease [Desulfobacterales bacterium SG8_35]|nr:MAG: permease [Desulfobacterales bacterium SG8_35]